MRAKQFDLKRYKLLTVVTVVILACIITMQGFWLYASFQREKELFKKNIDHALATAVSNVHLEKLLVHVGPELAALLKNSSQGSVSKDTKPGEPEQIQSGIIITLDSSGKDSAALLRQQLTQLTESVVQLKQDTTLTQNLSGKQLQQYKKAFRKQLLSYDIDLPYELAVLDSGAHFIYTSTDTHTFNAIATKTSVGVQNPVNLKGEYLVAAFPSSNLFVLRKIGLLLGVSMVLIILGCISFGYLISQFFRQKKLSELRDHFMNNMTHELKTPVSSVGVALEMLQDERNLYSDDKKKELLHVARKELSRLNLLIDNVLEIAATDKTAMELAPEPVMLLTWLQEIHANFSPLLSKTGATLSIAVQPQDLHATFDKTHMTNVIQNLVENALKYSDPSRKAVIAIEAAREKDGIVINVVDNGIGIPSQYQDKVFDKFFRVPNGDRHDVKGYGLGLSYVKTLVELHKGVIKLNSTPGAGSTFSLHLPQVL